MVHAIHVTSVHSRTDTRIFLKECRSLAGAGFRTTLLVADGREAEVRDGVSILSVRKEANRLLRILRTPIALYRRLRRLDGDVLHFHDPELLFIAILLKLRKYRVVFDFHEDVGLQILSKAYLAKPVRAFVSRAYSMVERFGVRRFDLVIAATPDIREKLLRFNKNAIAVNNYPLEGELEPVGEKTGRDSILAYVGGITAIRGIRQMVEALGHCASEVTLCLAGRFSPPSLQAEVSALPGWKKVREMGFLGRDEVRDLLSRARLGLVVFLPEPNHLRSQPNKMFEYMSAGVPIVASNFPAWKRIIEGRACGLCVDPENPREIAGAIDWILGNPLEAERMGMRGAAAVKEEFNWSKESGKLIAGYRSMPLPL